MKTEQLIEEAVTAIREEVEEMRTTSYEEWITITNDEAEMIKDVMSELFREHLNTITSKSAEVERKNAVNDCWYAILDLPHNSETGYTAELDLDDIYEKFKQLKSKGQNE